MGILLNTPFCSISIMVANKRNKSKARRGRGKGAKGRKPTKKNTRKKPTKKNTRKNTKKKNTQKKKYGAEKIEDLEAEKLHTRKRELPPQPKNRQEQLLSI